jgi:hypothetical protein
MWFRSVQIPPRLAALGLGVGVALWAGVAATAQDEPPPPVSPFPPPGIESNERTDPVGPAIDLSEDQLNALKNSEERISELARAVTDPALRATALNLVARSKIIGRKLDEARQDLLDASTAALELPPGLARDLRLRAIIQNLVALAHEEIIEAVPNNTPMGDFGESRSQTTFEARQKWFDRALEEWRRAAELSAAVDNPTYRNEEFAIVVGGQAADAQKVGRDTTRASSMRPDLEGQVPELLEATDAIYRQATEHAEQIDRPVWADVTMDNLAISAARSYQFARAVAILKKIPRPQPRSDALIRTAEELARRSSEVRLRSGDGLRQTWARVEEALREGPAGEPAVPSPLGLDLAGEDRVSSLMLRIESVAQQADQIGRLASQLGTELAHTRKVLEVERVLTPPDERDVSRSAAIAAQAKELQPALDKLRDRLAEALDQTRNLDPGPRIEALAKAMPKPDDPEIAAIRDIVQNTTTELEGLTANLDAGATEMYTDAARSIAAIRMTDPRDLAVRRLSDSLVAVGRFEDARATAGMLSDVDQKYFLLGTIAEAQGRRGLGEQARLWILNEPPERRPALQRRTAQGVLTALEQLRNQTAPVPGAVPYQN